MAQIGILRIDKVHTGYGASFEISAAWNQSGKTQSYYLTVHYSRSASPKADHGIGYFPQAESFFDPAGLSGRVFLCSG